MSKINYKLLMRSLDIPQFNTIEELSNLMGLSESLLYCLSQLSERYYRKFYVSKKNGGKREIFAPSCTMQIVQRWILLNILNKVRPSKQAMAFRHGKEFGCKANALIHIETHYGVAIDLNNFFPSIGANRIYTVFSNIGYDSLPATILTNLCTLDGYLPQGSPCSPALSNLVCLSLDARLNGLCEKRRIRFSRYADDMYFSCDNQDTIKKTIPIIRKIIETEGFTINENKIHYHAPSNRKMITGITISKTSPQSEYKLNAKKTLKREIRSEIFKTIFTGDYSAKEHILGEIAYVSYIEPDYLDRIKSYISSKAEKIEFIPELVDSYNNNQFYKELNKIECKSLSTLEEDFSDEDEFCMYMESLYEERQAYLKKHSVQDICKYEGWPPIFNSVNECDAEESFPF